jgi:hypothetical protein
MDARVTMQQIGTGNLMACGARDFSFDGSKLMFRVGSGRTLAKVIVTLEPDDTYSVRYCEMALRTYEVRKNEQVEGVYADNLGVVVRRLGDR